MELSDTAFLDVYLAAGFVKVEEMMLWKESVWFLVRAPKQEV